MSGRRKHVTQEAADVQPPAENQHIVQVLGSKGSNLFEVQYANGNSTLVSLPAKFNKTLWVKRGGYLIVETSPEAAAASSVTGFIVAVLYDASVKELKKLPGIWPDAFQTQTASEHVVEEDCPSEEGSGSSGGSIPQINNRRGRPQVAESTDEDSESS